MAHMDMMGGMGGWMWLMMVGWGAFAIGAIALVVWLIRRPSRSSGQSSGRQILEERYARGEIDTDEFRRRLEALER